MESLKLEQFRQSIDRFLRLRDATHFINKLFSGQQVCDRERDGLPALPGFASLLAHALTSFQIVNRWGRNGDSLRGQCCDNFDRFGALVGAEVLTDRLGFRAVLRFFGSGHA
jgi:hypothetical protein